MHSKGGAAVPAAPTEQYVNPYLVGALETSAPPESCTNNTKVQN